MTETGLMTKKLILVFITLQEEELRQELRELSGFTNVRKKLNSVIFLIFNKRKK